MILNKVLLLFLGATYGFLSAAGVFTVLLAVGLVPRFAGRTHTADHVFLYEEMVIWGGVTGCFVSVFEQITAPALFLQEHFADYLEIWRIAGCFLATLVGFFSGIFTGCLAMAIAEMLDSLPIFSRRISLHKGVCVVITSMALGKLAGSLFYFIAQIYQTTG